MNKIKYFALVFALLSTSNLLAQEVKVSQAEAEKALDGYYEELFEVPTENASLARDVMAKATAADSVFQVAQATDNQTTGHGNVLFRVTYSSVNDHWDLVLWSKNSYLGCTGFRKWYRVSNSTFGPWPYNGGALCVGWPPTYNNMHENIQIIDHDLDGDLDVFMMFETSPEIWTVYLYKNLESN